MSGKTYLRIEIKAPVTSTDVMEQAKLLTKLEEPLEQLKKLLPEGTEVISKLMTERGPLAATTRQRMNAATNASRMRTTMIRC